MSSLYHQYRSKEFDSQHFQAYPYLLIAHNFFAKSQGAHIKPLEEIFLKDHFRQIFLEFSRLVPCNLEVIDKANFSYSFHL
jgi:hypothetical protein